VVVVGQHSFLIICFFEESVLFFELPAYPLPNNVIVTANTEIKVSVVITNDGRTYSNPLEFTYIPGKRTRVCRLGFLLSVDIVWQMLWRCGLGFDTIPTLLHFNFVQYSNCGILWRMYHSELITGFLPLLMDKVLVCQSDASFVVLLYRRTLID
jgi:hypothetical protein